MPKPPKMTDIAKAVGVSSMTVSRAFNQDASVGQKTREKILRVADEMGYVFDSTASNLRSQRTGFVAVTIPSLNNANFAETVRGLTDALQGHDLQILLGYTDYRVETEEQLIRQFLRRRPEAVVVTGGRHTDHTRQLLKNADIPVVETWDLPTDPVGHVVGFSNADCMGQMVDHLHSSGARRLAFIGGDDTIDTRGTDRRRGFEIAANAAGLPFELISAGPPPITMRQGAQAMARLLDRCPQVDAVVCVSDLSAFGAVSECLRRGLNVPQDIKIAGFGAFDIAEMSVPALTTIDAHSFEIGRQTGQLLVSVLRNNAAEKPPSIIRIHPTLKITQSTAAT